MIEDINEPNLILLYFISLLELWMNFQVINSREKYFSVMCYATETLFDMSASLPYIHHSLILKHTDKVLTYQHRFQIHSVDFHSNRLCSQRILVQFFVFSPGRLATMDCLLSLCACSYPAPKFASCGFHPQLNELTTELYGRVYRCWSVRWVSWRQDLLQR